MWTPFCDGSRSTVQSIVARISFSRAPRPIRTAFWTPVTPARDRPSGTSGAEACRSSSSWRAVSLIRVLSATVPDAQRHLLRPARLARVPRRAHAARHRARLREDADERTVELEPPADRYVEMIEAASAQMAELLDELSLVARIESGRYDPGLREADTLALAHAAAERLGEDRVSVSGEGATITTDFDAVDRGVSALVAGGAAPRRAGRGRGRRARRGDRRLADHGLVGARSCSGRSCATSARRSPSARSSSSAAPSTSTTAR